MIKKMRLQNFKVFGSEAPEFRLAPITIVLGCNSSGKSSILQSLLLLAQGWEGGRLPELEPNGRFKRLGRAGNLAHRHQSCFISIRLEVGPSCVTWEFQCPTPTESGLAERCELERVSVETVTIDEAGEQTRFVASAVVDVEHETYTFAVPVEEPPTGNGAGEFNQDHGASDSKKRIELIELDAYYDRAESPTTDGLRAGCMDQRRTINDGCRRIHTVLRNLRYVGPMRSPGRRLYGFEPEIGHDWVGVQGDQFAHLLQTPEVIARVNQYLTIINVPYSLTAESLRTSDLVYDVLLHDVWDAKGGLHSIPLGTPDVGFGISQLLPVLTQVARSAQNVCSTGDTELVLLEQPELHLHPRWQSLLADVFTHALNESRGKYSDTERENEDSFQIICETHSKELVEQFCALVRKGQLQSTDVCFLVVDRERGEERIVTRIGLTETGDFSRSWPTNYFM